MNIKDLDPNKIEDVNVKPLNIRDIDQSKLEDVEEDSTEYLDALGRGALQGTTLGFSDEIYGAYKGAQAAMKGKDFTKEYEKARDEERSELKRLETKHPYLFKGSEILSGLVIPGASLKGAKTLGQFAARGAAAGGLEGVAAGAGYSQGEDAGEVARDALIGGAIGITLGGAVGAIGKGIQSKLRGGTQDAAEEVIAPQRIDQAYESFSKNKPDTDRLFGAVMNPEHMETVLKEEGLPNTRSQLIRFMQFTTDKATETTEEALSKKPIRADFQGLDALVDKFNKQIQQGQVTKELWDEFHLARELKDVLDAEDIALRASNVYGIDDATEEQLKRLSKKSLTHFDQRDPLRGLRRYVLDANVAARQIDDATGLDIELLQNQLYAQMNKKKGFDRLIANTHETAKKLRDKTSMDDKQLVRLIESGNEGNNPIAAAYSNTLKSLYEESKKLGLDIEYRSNYVPLRRKTGVDLVMALEKKAHELMPDRNILLVDDKMSKDMRALKESVETLYGKKIDTTNELKDAVNNLRTVETVKRTTDPEVNVTFERTDDLPEWLREYNIDKLIWQNTDQASNAAFILPKAKELDSRIFALEKLGMKNAAQWLRNYRLDVSGISRPKPFTGDAIQRLKNKLAFFGEDHDSNLARYAPDFIDTMASAIYPNYIGLNPASVIRNLQQPVHMTLAETGFKDGSKSLAKSYGRFLGDINRKGWKKMKQEMIDEGTLPESTSVADFEGVRSGVADWTKSKGIKTTQKVIDRYADFVMWGFTKSDEFNRMITKYMAEDIAGDIVKGKVKISKKLPKAVQGRLKRVISSNVPDEMKAEQTNKIVRDWLVVQTQLAYGKVGGNELGRTMGPGLSMLTKWPVAITSDVYDKVNKKEFGRLASKYLGPAVALSLVQRSLTDSEGRLSPRQQSLLGHKGLSGHAPIHSLWSMPDIFVPVNVSSPLGTASTAFKYIQEELGGEATDRDRLHMKKKAQNFMSQYLPVGGGIARQAERFNQILENKRAD